MPTDIELHVPIEHSQTAAECIAAHCHLSPQRIAKTMHCGAAWLSRDQQTLRIRQPTHTLLPGDELHLYYDAATIDYQIPPARLLADEQEYSLWYKPAGLLAQGNKWGDHYGMQRWTEQHLNDGRGSKIVHRLDKDTQGLMLLAHTKTAAASLGALFQQRDIHKRYLAITRDLPLFNQGPLSITEPVDGKTAHTEVRLVEQQQGYSLLSVRIATGRRHQIRQHLSGMAAPIIGDRIYGEAHPAGLQLCAVALAFTCPLTGKPRDYETPLALQPSIQALMSSMAPKPDSLL